MRQFGLIGYPLSHSFSKGYFAEKFSVQNITNAQYDNFPIPSINDFLNLWEMHPTLEGLNITIPYKKEVIPFLDIISPEVQAIQACNCIRKVGASLIGYNTDVVGFEKSLLPFLKPHHTAALILGTGGAAAAVKWVFDKLNISHKSVSRSGLHGTISYESLTSKMMLEHTLIVNTSPIGMYPNIDQAPSIPYEFMNETHHLFDLTYNPPQTLFLTNGLRQGATIQNGLEMLYIQAEESWRIWNTTAAH